MKKKVTEWKKKHLTDKRLICRKYKEATYIMKTKKLIFKWAKDLNRNFTKKDIQEILNTGTREMQLNTTIRHSSTLAWKIPWTEEPGRLQSMGSQRVGHG